jgi:adenine-specific DNA glycosylase
VLEDLVPAKIRVSMHVGLIRLGREICRAGRPRCEDCPLQDLCPTAPVVTATAASTDLRSRSRSKRRKKRDVPETR